jgi:hypothetical protein
MSDMRLHVPPVARLVLGVVLVAASLFIAQRQHERSVGTDWTPVVEPLPSPAGAGTSAPQLTTDGRRIFLSWLESLESGTSLKFAERTGSGWSDVRTAKSADNLVVNFADVPSVRMLADGTLAAQWLEEDGPDPEAYTLHLSWSKDGGSTWTPSLTPHHDGKETQHGFASLFQAPGGGLGLVWLDGRTIEETGDMGLQAATFGTDGAQRSELTVDPRGCECCPTAAAATAEGVVVAYRDRSDSEVRDIAVTRLEDDRWSEPALVHADNWEIDACPVNGPAISARDRAVAVAWFTAKDDEARSFVAFSPDGGRTFGAPIRVDEGSTLGRVGVELVSDGSAAVSWIDFSRKRAEVMVRRVDANGSRGQAVHIADATGNQFPRIARGTGELLLAWTETADDASSRVRVARVALPTP